MRIGVIFRLIEEKCVWRGMHHRYNASARMQPIHPCRVFNMGHRIGLWIAMGRIIGRTLGKLVASFLATSLLINVALAQSTRLPTTQPQSELQRYENLLGILEGQNSPQARRTGARELLIQGWPEAPSRLTAILRGSNRPARIAVALALSDVPERLTAEYLDPLFEMLNDGEEDARKAAAQALAAAADSSVITRLKMIAVSRERPILERRAAIESFGQMTQREAVLILFEVLTDPNPEISDAALQTIEQMTGQDFSGNTELAQSWWNAIKTKTDSQWQKIQIERLIRLNRAREQRCRDLEARLATTLRDAYFRTPEAQRPPLLSSFLTDNAVAVRRMGLALVQSMLAEGKLPPNEFVLQVRDLMNAAEPDVRAAAIQTVTTLRDSADAVALQTMLKTEQNRLVRRALVNGLGYVGTADCLSMLLEQTQSADAAIVNESVTAIGRLIERGVLDAALKEQASHALYSQYEATPREDAAARERLLWALSRLTEPRLADVFIACLNPSETAPVRLAAIRGIIQLIDPRSGRSNGNGNGNTATQTARPNSNTSRLLDALAPLVEDPTADIRRACVETIAQFAMSDTRIDTLWPRLDPSRESEETIRQAAWRGVLRVLSKRPYAEIAARLERLPGDDATRRTLTIEILQAALENRGDDPSDNEPARIHAHLAVEYAVTGQIEPAMSNYISALDKASASNPPHTQQIALELLRLAIRTGRYDAQLAAVLNDVNPALDGAALWETARAEIERGMTAGNLDQMIVTLDALRSYPLAHFPPDARTAIENSLQQAHRIQYESDILLIDALLKQMREKPEDTRAQESVATLGDRAIPHVRTALRSALSEENTDQHWVERLTSLFKTLQPDWTGFTPDATLEHKLRSLE